MHVLRAFIIRKKINELNRLMYSSSKHRIQVKFNVISNNLL